MAETKYQPLETEDASHASPLLRKGQEKRWRIERFSLYFVLVALILVALAGFNRPASHHSRKAKDSFSITLKQDDIVAEIQANVDEEDFQNGCCKVSKKYLKCEIPVFSAFCGEECLKTCAEYLVDKELDKAQAYIEDQVMSHIADNTYIDEYVDTVVEAYEYVKSYVKNKAKAVAYEAVTEATGYGEDDDDDSDSDDSDSSDDDSDSDDDRRRLSSSDGYADSSSSSVDSESSDSSSSTVDGGLRRRMSQTIVNSTTKGESKNGICCHIEWEGGCVSDGWSMTLNCATT